MEIDTENSPSPPLPARLHHPSFGEQLFLNLSNPSIRKADNRGRKITGKTNEKKFLIIMEIVASTLLPI